jgi:lipopolysaccharide export system permease protein
MKIYLKFFTLIFLKSLLYVFFVMLSLVFILNILTELDFFKDIDVKLSFTLFLAFLNSPALIFEMFPFIFLITTQIFFIKLFENKEIEILKYSGFKNSKIVLILCSLSLITGLMITIFFYHFSSNLKNFYLELKSPHTNDGKYLAVVTRNGLWIKDKVNENILMINSSKIDQNFLIDNFITEFDKNYIVLRNIKSKKIDVSNEEWVIYNPKIFKKNNYQTKDSILLKTNFDFKRIKSLYSNLSSLNFYELFKLKQNYNKLNYSTVEIDLQLLKLISYPVYLLLMSLFSALIMLRIKRFDNSTFKISIGLFISVIIYYFNNFFYVMGSTERLTIATSIFVPILILSIINSFMLIKINEK